MRHCLLLPLLISLYYVPLKTRITTTFSYFYNFLLGSTKIRYCDISNSSSFDIDKYSVLVHFSTYKEQTEISLFVCDTARKKETQMYFHISFTSLWICFEGIYVSTFIMIWTTPYIPTYLLKILIASFCQILIRIV